MGRSRQRVVKPVRRKRRQVIGVPSQKPTSRDAREIAETSESGVNLAVRDEQGCPLPFILGVEIDRSAVDQLM